jgi:hypothetical protein
MNTARAFGPAAVLGFPNDSHWIVRWAFIPTPPPSHWHSPRFTSYLSLAFWFFLRAIARGKNRNSTERERGKRPLSPYLSPQVLTRSTKKAMLTTHHVAPFIVLAGPISRRTAGHRVLRHPEIVRHDFFAFRGRPWMLTQRNDA